MENKNIPSVDIALVNGCTMYRQSNEVGGFTYCSDRQRCVDVSKTGHVKL